MADVNDQLRAADTAKRAYQDAVPDPWLMARWSGSGTPRCYWIATWRSSRSASTATFLAIERDGLLLTFGGPNIWLLWNGNILYGWAGSVFTYEPRSAAEQDSAKKLLAYFIDNDIRPTGDD